MCFGSSKPATPSTPAAPAAAPGYAGESSEAMGRSIRSSDTDRAATAFGYLNTVRGSLNPNARSSPFAISLFRKA